MEAYESASSDVKWLVTDQLGTPRMIFDKTGAFDHVSRHDYLSFGEELFAGGRTTANGYTNNDGTRQKFTSYEADSETGLNYARARYQSSAQGRFTGADRLLASASLVQPQSWNRYSYVLNNPVNLTDPSGLITDFDASIGGASMRGRIGQTGAFTDELEGDHRLRIRANAYAAAANSAYANGDMDAYGRILDSNPHIGDGNDSSGGTVSVQGEVITWNTNSTMIIVWDMGWHTPGHVSSITMQDDTSYSWEGIISWTVDQPSSNYTNRRSKTSAGMGYVLDFGSELNAKFQRAMLSAYDTPGIGRRPYGPITNNCGLAFVNGIIAISKDIGVPASIMITPGQIKNYIEQNLQQKYVKGQVAFRRH